ncbi:MAG: hypothetical protein HRT69_18600 [Flavobacteriaceae bacterium]|nr:hypothetical protein [Flavobacteriaceae bacterium]
MKPKFDINNPIVKLGLEALKKQTKIALETSQDVEKAIMPIYAIPKAKAHQKPKRKAEQFGSGVLFTIKENYFILSTTHLFEAFDGYALQTGFGDGEQIEALGGERFSSGKIENPYSNQLDATVFHIQTELSQKLKNLALGMDDLDLEKDDKKTKSIYLASGFRIKKSNTTGNQVYSKREAFPSIQVDKDVYEMYGIDNIRQIITSYEDDILVNGHWQKSPKPKGFSGGGLIKTEGTDALSLKSAASPKQKLKGIITEQHREKNNKPGILISTNINVHMSLIFRFMPELFE